MQTMMMTKKLALALALAISPVASVIAASGLGVEATDGSVSVGNAGAVSFTIANDGTQALSDVRWYSTSGYSAQCATQTDAGRGFSLEASLEPGDRARCTMLPVASARQRAAAVVVSAREPDGSATLRHASMNLLGGIAPSQGIVVVAGGAVHADTDLDGQLDAGEAIAYDYTLVNAGTQALSGLGLTDLAGIVNCPSPTLAIAAAMTCTRTYTISAGDAAAGLVVNEAEVTGAATDGQAVQAADVLLTLNFAGSAGIRVFKSPQLVDDVDASGYASADDVLGYTFLVKNSNAQTLTSVNLVEPDPSLIDGPIACEATTLIDGQAFTGLGSGTLASQDVLRCTAEHTITAAEATAGEALNLAEASGVPPVGGMVWGTGASAVAIAGSGALVVTKTVNTPMATYGSYVTYTITVRNEGSTDIQNVTISDPIPTGLDSFAWTCVGSGVACPATSGSGAIAASIAVFPAGAQVVYTINAIVSFSAPSTVLNVVSVTPQTNVLCAPAGTPPPCSATVPFGTGQVFAVPIDGRFVQWALVFLLIMFAAARLRLRGL
jgi:uncharacterized repeat protein (TIGR01451 family)